MVETSEGNATLVVARFTAEMAWANADPELAETRVAHICDEAEGLMEEGRWSDLVSLLLTSFDLVFANAPEKDLECIFAVICNLIVMYKLPECSSFMHKLLECSSFWSFLEASKILHIE